MCPQLRLKPACASVQSNQSSLSEWRNFVSLPIKCAPCSDLTVWMHRLSWIFPEHTCLKVLFLTLRLTCYHNVVWMQTSAVFVRFSLNFTEFVSMMSSSVWWFFFFFLMQAYLLMAFLVCLSKFVVWTIRLLQGFLKLHGKYQWWKKCFLPLHLNLSVQDCEQILQFLWLS